MDRIELMKAIEAKRGTSAYSAWVIGVTDDPNRRRKEHEDEGRDTRYWTHWKADAETIARVVEMYFLEKGMKGGSGGGAHPAYVYIF